jgi:hypothetical protein
MLHRDLVDRADLPLRKWIDAALLEPPLLFVSVDVEM